MVAARLLSYVGVAPNEAMNERGQSVDQGRDDMTGRVLLAGATGFVGRHLYPALCGAGLSVVCASRNPGRASRDLPNRQWVRLDVEDEGTFATALSGVGTVIYLVHQMGGGVGYPEREANAAIRLRQAAAEAGVRRIVYLGGVAPTGQVSPHLQSRLHTGVLLRAGTVPTVELRAGMIIGEGSASWQIVRDLAARLPAMVLPRWLNNRSSPVAIADVVAAILWAMSSAPARSAWYDVSGPELLSHRELITRVARLMGKRPAMVGIPVVSPALSSYWIALVTRIDLELARELVQGLQSDLIPAGPAVWDHACDHALVGLEEAAKDILAAGPAGEVPAPAVWGRMQSIGESARSAWWA